MVRLLGTTIATSALTVGSLCVLAAPAFAGTEDTTCVNIDFSGNTSNGNASVTVLGQKCSSPVKVRAWTECYPILPTGPGPGITYYGPAVTSGISRVTGCVSMVNGFDSFGWQYYKSGAWHNGSSGANT